MSTSKLALLPAFSVAIFGAPPSFSQQAPAAASGGVEMTMEERRQSVVNLERHIADREERMAQISETIIGLDARVEKRIDRIVEKLKGIDDSKDSQVRVAMTKSGTIDGLGKTIDYYVRKRDGLREKLRAPSDLPRETLEGDLRKFDERIDKRVGQIIDLTKTFTEYKELDKYKSWTSSNWYGTYTHKEISDDWRLNRKQVRRTESEQKKVAGELQRSIDRMTRQAADLREKLRNPKLSALGREIYQSDLDHIQGQIDKRRYQIDDVMTPDGGGGRKVSRNEAHTIQQAIDDEAKDLRWDFFAIFEHYDQLNKERANVAALKDNLQARKDWLAEHDK